MSKGIIKYVELSEADVGSHLRYRAGLVGSVVCDERMELSHLTTSLAQNQTGHGLLWTLA